MRPFLCRIFDKPVGDGVLDGCRNFYNKQSNPRTPSLFGSTHQRRENNSEESQPPKKPQRGIMRRGTFGSLPEHELPPTSKPTTMGLYNVIQWPPSEPRISTDDLSESMIQVHIAQPGNDKLLPLEKEDDSDRREKVAENDEPCDRYIKQLIRATRLYCPEIGQEEADDFVLVTMLMTTRMMTASNCEDNVDVLPVYSAPSTVYVVSQ